LNSFSGNELVGYLPSMELLPQNNSTKPGCIKKWEVGVAGGSPPRQFQPSPQRERAKKVKPK